ncbi:hypothetical protein SIN8267_02625 [Sinobacterium norvegicum]|uniref:Uncharacterized protein n=1 Tax=Sinobacterium norvegicum TaxID=1641715 RepID=A0ABM9AIC1_9GAMM|nr:hypothetical protein [Sinobacterium norvegicum]CAH0992499.1 hypothetical protein SIN8267_02625 [Sinobacterium norvegicum]
MNKVTTLSGSTLVLLITLIAGCSLSAPPQSLPADRLAGANSQRYIYPRLSYPEQWGGYELRDIKEYDDPRLGLVLRYVEKDNDQSYFDLFLYPIPQEWFGYSSNELVRAHYDHVRADIYEAYDTGYYQQLSVVSEKVYRQSNLPSAMVQGVFKLQSSNLMNYSVLYLTIRQGYFYKLRGTYPQNPFYTGGDHLQQMAKQIVSQVDIEL